MQIIHNESREPVSLFGKALYNLDREKLPALLKSLFAPDCAVHLSFPFEDLTGPKELWSTLYEPLIAAFPDLERRVFIQIGGMTEHGQYWVGCAGYYVGVFERHWLDIPPTLHFCGMRFHEFFRIEGGVIVELQALWDIPELMMQAGAWPMAPSLGVALLVPGPAAQDGLVDRRYDAAESEASMKLVLDMLDGLLRHAEGGPEAMQLERYWHPAMTWYGPAGIGTCRRVSGFRNWHQIPFLKALPDRGDKTGFTFHFISEGPYVAETGWPNMQMTVTGDGWLGIVPGGQRITMRSLDFWRCEEGKIRENWVLVDLLSVYDQLGVDVFSRMREMTPARQLVRPRL